MERHTNLRTVYVKGLVVSSPQLTIAELHLMTDVGHRTLVKWRRELAGDGRTPTGGRARRRRSATASAGCRRAAGGGARAVRAQRTHGRHGRRAVGQLGLVPVRAGTHPVEAGRGPAGAVAPAGGPHGAEDHDRAAQGGVGCHRRGAAQRRHAGDRVRARGFAIGGSVVVVLSQQGGNVRRTRESALRVSRGQPEWLDHACQAHGCCRNGESPWSSPSDRLFRGIGARRRKLGEAVSVRRGKPREAPDFPGLAGVPHRCGGTHGVRVRRGSGGCWGERGTSGYAEGHDAEVRPALVTSRGSRTAHARGEQPLNRKSRASDAISLPRCRGGGGSDRDRLLKHPGGPSPRCRDGVSRTCSEKLP